MGKGRRLRQQRRAAARQRAREYQAARTPGAGAYPIPCPECRSPDRVELPPDDPRARDMARQVGEQLGGGITVVLCRSCGALGALGGWEASGGFFDDGLDEAACPDCGGLNRYEVAVQDLAPNHRQQWEESAPRISEHHGVPIEALTPTFCRGCGSFYLEW